VLVVLVVAIAAVLSAATAAEAKDSLQTNHRQRDRGQAVTYSGTTSCRSVFIYSRPSGPNRALNRQTKRVTGGRFAFHTRVRRLAADGRYSIRVRCVDDHRLVGARGLLVGQLANSGSRPMAPQLLLGLGLVEAGGILIAIGRRPQFPKTRLRARRGLSGAQRKRVHVYAD
jgi:hypothetical protein